MTVYVHNPGTFQEKETRQRVISTPEAKPKMYLVHFKTTYQLERQYVDGIEYVCGTGNYSYDAECMYKRLDALAADGNCTSPW